MHNLSRAVARVADLTRAFSRVQVALEAVLRQTQPPGADGRSTVQHRAA